MTDSTETAAGKYLHCGWGRLIFGHTFPDHESLAEAILKEAPGQRNIAFYLNDPHLVLNHAPQQLFLDPSNTYRLNFADYEPFDGKPPGFSVAPFESPADLHEINRIYQALNMVPIDVDRIWEQREDPRFAYFVARSDSGKILGATIAVDHALAFDDIRNGCSLWALGVDPQGDLPGVGVWLARTVIEYFIDRGRREMDLSVMHDNEVAQKLYLKLGFKKIAVFCVKTRNNFANEKLLVGSPPEDGFNPYAKIIIHEALRRGIHLDPLDPERGFFRLNFGARSVTCRESLSEMTTAIALQRTSDKQLTLEMLRGEGLETPEQLMVGLETPLDASLAFMEKHQSVVVKPLHGEQGQGISVDIREPADLQQAIDKARDFHEVVLVEEFCEGHDLRIIVINGEMVAAATRRPPLVIGTGRHTIRELIEKLSRRREAATGGESSIPIDEETNRCLRLAGYTLDDTLPPDVHLTVRKTANLHTGGTIHDVTEKLHPDLAAAAIKAADILEIGVVGFDFLVPDVERPEYVIIEANERPGLANHEPQPTAQKFVDFLFPNTTRLRAQKELPAAAS